MQNISFRITNLTHLPKILDFYLTFLPETATNCSSRTRAVYIHLRLALVEEDFPLRASVRVIQVPLASLTGSNKRNIKTNCSAGWYKKRRLSGLIPLAEDLGGEAVWTEQKVTRLQFKTVGTLCVPTFDAILPGCCVKLFVVSSILYYVLFGSIFTIK